MYTTLCINTYCDVTDLVNHGMVENMKLLNIFKTNIFFLKNKFLISGKKTEYSVF